MELNGRKAFALTLGCRLNQADTALIFSRLREIGFEIIKPGKNNNPDLIVINTCTVTLNASSKSRKAARQFRKLYPECCIVVTGCDCNNSRKQWEAEGWVDIVLLNKEKKLLAERVYQWFEQKEEADKISDNECLASVNRDTETVFAENTVAAFPFRTRAFLKIQEGCNSFCSYCIVPYVRGPERSRASGEILKEAEALIRAGHKELIVTGVNISSYNDGNYDIITLIKKICEIDGDFRLRLSSMEPHGKNFELIDLIRDNKKICRFLHVPVQSGSDTILKAMNRTYSVTDFKKFISYAEKEVEGIHLGTDVILGFPGESEALFQETVEFFEEIRFANIHVFRFSPRKGTPAAEFDDQVNPKIIKKRAEIIQKIADKQKYEFFTSQIGSPLDILIESVKNNRFAVGISDNYIKVKIDNNNLIPGHFVQINLNKNMCLSK